jgi:drug/metabolite transporter (DMT)-like permease
MLATATSVVNVLADVCRKKAVEKNNLLGTSFWMRMVAALGFCVAFAWRVMTLPGPLLHGSGALFPRLGGGFGAHWSPLEQFLFCLILDGTMLAMALLFYIRALQVSDLSLSVPFLAFTPVLLIPTGYFFLHEIPNRRQLLGVVLVVLGSVTINRSSFREGWLGPLKAIFREKGSRYMLMVAVIFSVSNPVDKMIVLMSDPMTAAFGYGLVVLVSYGLLMLVLGREWMQPLERAPWWIVGAGVLDAATQLLQFASHRYIDVVLTIAIKRAGIILSVVAGWLIFRERHIEDRLAAAFVMLSGALLIYLPMSEGAQVVLIAVVLVVLVFGVGSHGHRTVVKR